MLSSQTRNINNTIDLTGDDEEQSEEQTYQRTPTNHMSIPVSVPGYMGMSMNIPHVHPHQQTLASTSSAFFPSHHHPNHHGHGHGHTHGPMMSPSVFTRSNSMPMSISSPSPSMKSEQLGSNVIDLTRDSTPPAQAQTTGDPKRPACIGQLGCTALVLYPIPYLTLPSSPAPNQPPQSEWAPVRLRFEGTSTANNGGGGGGNPTINIFTPPSKSPASGAIVQGDHFGVVEQRVSSVLGPMMGKGLVRCDAKVLRGRTPGNMPPILPLQILLFTPLGNIPVLGPHLSSHQILLNNPSPPFDIAKLHASTSIPYQNPHNPPPGGFPPFRNVGGASGGGGARNGNVPWLRTGQQGAGMGQGEGKSVEVQRGHAETMFKNLRSGEELEECDPPEGLVRTGLYPHQKKALTFLLEREQERPGASKLWTPKVGLLHDTEGPKWVNLVTNKEVGEEPVESKSSLLADDMGLGKTITCVSLIAATLDSAEAFSKLPLEEPVEREKDVPNIESLALDQFKTSVWGMSMPSIVTTPGPNAALTSSHSMSSFTSSQDTSNLSKKALAKLRASEKAFNSTYTRQKRLKNRSRATLVCCPLSTVSNWEEQFREHWGGGGVEVVAPGCEKSKKEKGESKGKGEMMITMEQGEGWKRGMKIEKEKEDWSMGMGGAAEPSLPMGVSITSSSTSTTTNGHLDPGMANTRGPSMSRTPSPKMSAATTDWKSSASTQTPTEQFSTRRPLRLYVYHGTARRPDPAFLADFDVVITTYATLASEYSKQMRSIESSNGDGTEGEDSAGDVVEKCGIKRKKLCSGGGGVNGEEMSSPLQCVYWFRVVLDEAHSIKETSTVASRASCDLLADRRLCLTGTPVQNKLDDVYALVKFLRIEPLDDKAVWTEHIGGPVKFGQSLGVARLQTVMKSITLRRTKESKAQDGRCILALPPRRDELRYLKFDENEQKIYDAVFVESKAEFNELSDKNEVMKNYVGILQKILRLRQICDHWELVRGGLPGIGGEGKTFEDVVKDIERDGLTLSLANQMFGLLRDSGGAQCVECGCEVGAPIDGNAEIETTAGMGMGNGMCPDELQIPPTKKSRKTKGGNGTGSGTLSSAGTRQNTPMPTNVYRPVLTRCQHLFCIECFRLHAWPQWPASSPDTNPSIEEETRPCFACQTTLVIVRDVVEISPDAYAPPPCPPPSTAPGAGGKKARRVKGSVNPATFIASTKIKALLNDLVESSKLNPYSTNYDPEGEVLMVDANGNQTDDNIIKTVVFSQWTSMLDKIEEGLELCGIHYDRLDGTMKREDRSQAMEELKHNKRCEVLLVSLRAGGVGLNLTAAQRVYLMDPYWNPAVENQAVDRIHRLGQKKPVTTIKLIIENSIEAKLLEVQKKKTALANMTLAGTTYSKAELMQRRLEELSELFGQ